ncbi:MAG: AP2 domain-containing protein [Akkermansia sp.]|nr:AP2 domain-containing protein [Akkermansia sp.]
MTKHRHITRLTRQHHKQEAYLVRVSKHGRKMHRYFHLRDYPTAEAALQAALTYRAQAYTILGLNTPAPNPTQLRAETAAITAAAATLPAADRAALAQELITTLIPSNS